MLAVVLFLSIATYTVAQDPSTGTPDPSCFRDDDCQDYDPGQRTYCQINCPSDSYPPHTALLYSPPPPLTLTGNTFINVPRARQPNFAGNITFFARINHVAGTQGYLIFYGTTTDRPNFSLKVDSNRGPSISILTLQYISNRDNTLETVDLEIPSVANGDHCLTIIFTSPLSIYVDDNIASNARATLPDLDLATGLSDDSLARLVIGGRPNGPDYFQGSIYQLVVFNDFISDDTRSSVCSLVTSTEIEGQCEPYLDRGDTCIEPNTQTSTLCASKLDRCDPSLRCLSDIDGKYTCQYVPPICTSDDDCLGYGFCASAIPSYGTSYYESDALDIPGDETTFISKAEQFDGLRIIKKPATDHPDLDMDFTIVTHVQQDDSNTGYVIAKGYNDEMRDWGLLLAYNRIEIVYRAVTGSYISVTFSNITVADGQNHSVAAIIDSAKSEAVISVDGVISTTELIEQPEFQPGFNFLYIGGRPETTESASNRFKGTIYHLSVYNSVLTIDDIQQLFASFQPDFIDTDLTTTRYCREYVQRNRYCYLGDNTDFRCMPPARCVPTVVNGDMAVELPEQGTTFTVQNIIGRCVSPCDCGSEPTGQVCGSDGRTYPSTCYANCADIEVVANGACTLTYQDLYNRRNS